MKRCPDDDMESLLEEAAERGAEKALKQLTEQLYQEIGRTVMKKILSIVGIGLVMLAIYAVKQGWVK